MTDQKSGSRIESFDFLAGHRLANGKYEIVTKLGDGWESEVYMLRERNTGIERAAKFFFPHRNRGARSSTIFAKKLHKLRDCPLLIRYFTQEQINFKDKEITFLVSDYVEGEALSEFIQTQPGARLHTFEALHLLYEITKGLEYIHNAREYHGDLHADNIILKRKGLGFDIKMLDPYHWDFAKSDMIIDDMCNLIKIFYDAIGGNRFYSKQAPEIKEICCGLRRSTIEKKFKTAGHLRRHLETINWKDNYL